MLMQNNPTQNQVQPQSPKMHPNMPPQMQAEMGIAPSPRKPINDFDEGEMGEDASEEDIVAGLEDHLAAIPDEQKKYLVEALTTAPEMMISVLGIVNGPEVANYFKKIYETYISKNSAQGQPQQAAPSPNSGPMMAPQQQAKATPTNPMMEM